MAKKTSNPTHTAVRHIKHDGDYYNPGDGIALTDEQAEGLGENVKPIPASSKPSQSTAGKSGKDSTQAPPTPAGDTAGKDSN